jgi:hypothetical protein
MANCCIVGRHNGTAHEPGRPLLVVTVALVARLAKSNADVNIGARSACACMMAPNLQPCRHFAIEHMRHHAPSSTRGCSSHDSSCSGCYACCSPNRLAFGQQAGYAANKALKFRLLLPKQGEPASQQARQQARASSVVLHLQHAEQ